MPWIEVKSELAIDHSISSVVVGGAVPDLMVNTFVRNGRSALYFTTGPFSTLEEASAEAEAAAVEHGVDRIYRILPLGRR